MTSEDAVKIARAFTDPEYLKEMMKDYKPSHAGLDKKNNEMNFEKKDLK
jgi:hypothetical protein